MMHSNALQCLTHLRWRKAEVTTISCTKAFTSPIMAMSYFYLKYHKHFLHSGIYVTIFYCDLLVLNSTHHILNFKRQNLSLAVWHKVVFSINDEKNWKLYIFIFLPSINDEKKWKWYNAEKLFLPEIQFVKRLISSLCVETVWKL